MTIADTCETTRWYWYLVELYALTDVGLDVPIKQNDVLHGDYTLSSGEVHNGKEPTSIVRLKLTVHALCH